MSADSDWRDDDRIARHKENLIALDKIERDNRRVARHTHSEFALNNVFDAMFDNVIDEVRSNPAKQVGLTDVPIPTKYVAPLAPDVVRSRAVETRRAREHAEAVKLEKLMNWFDE